MSFVFSVRAPGSYLEVDIPDDLLSANEFSKKLPRTLDAIAKEAKQFWEAEASRRLTSSRDKYVSSIRIEGTSIYLEGGFANDVENGKDQYSLYSLFLKSRKLRPRPVKMPRAVAASLPRTGRKATTWMVIPLNLSRSSNNVPTAFRNFHDAQPTTMWQHPGFKGVQIMDAVVEELENNIIPKYIEKLIDEVIAGAL